MRNTVGSDNVMTVSAEHGLVRQEEYFSKRVASDKLDGYWLLQPGDFVYNKSASKGAPWGVCARNDTSAPAVVTPLYIPFRPGPEVDSDYLVLALNSDQFFDSLASSLREGARAHGALNVKIGEFFGARVPVPPRPVQTRIVKVVSAVDNQITALDAEVKSHERMVSALRASIFSSLNHATVPAGEKFAMQLGRQKSARQSVGEYVRPYLRAANINPGALSLDDVQAMNFSPEEQKKYDLQQGDIVLVEGGSVGQAARWSGEIEGFVGFDKHVIRLRPVAGRSTSEFALQWCHWARESHVFSDQATGITIKALGFGRASRISVPDVPYDEQDALMAPLKAMDEYLAALRAEVAALKTYRNRLRSALLSREIEMSKIALA
ncbi:hypothetical protein AB0C13_05275 [Streptomyces sp. NPDC049099]|uniref:hypothetical protein n=1 Tax=Streptomyces sp. NPDC049099 TaxID=3155768 RepID=UPI003442DF3C